MHRSLLPLIVLSALIAPLAHAEVKSYPAGKFDGVASRAMIDVIVEVGPEASVTVEQKDGDFSDIVIDLDGDTLEITRKSATGNRRWFGGASTSIRMEDGERVLKVNGKRVPVYTVRVTTPVLNTAAASSSSTLIATGINSADFKGDVSSSSRLELSGQATRASLDASSSGDLFASDFLAGNLDLSASSSASLEAATNGTEVSVQSSSSSDVTLVSSGNANFDVDVSSSGDVGISGTCNTFRVDVSSSGDVSAKDLICKSARISGSSSGDVEIQSSENVYARASSGADISIYGSPADRDIKESSGGDVDFNS